MHGRPELTDIASSLTCIVVMALVMKFWTPRNVMRLEGDNTAGLAGRLKHAWATAGINLHGAIMTVIGTKFVGFVTFDSVEDANKAARILAEARPI